MDIEYSSDIPDVPLPPGPLPSRFVKADRSYLLLNSLIYITIGVLTNDLPLIILILEISKTTAVDEGTVAAEEDEVGTVVEPTVMNGLIVGAVVITTTGIETTEGDIVMTTMKGTVGVVAEDVGVDADVVDNNKDKVVDSSPSRLSRTMPRLRATSARAKDTKRTFALRPRNHDRSSRAPTQRRLPLLTPRTRTSPSLPSRFLLRPRASLKSTTKDGLPIRSTAPFTRPTPPLSRSTIQVLLPT